jgi:hypothetical protein
MMKAVFFFVSCACGLIVAQAAEPTVQQRPSQYVQKYEELRKRLKKSGLVILPEDKKAVQELEAKIQAEIKSLSEHPWAGTYYCGDGLENSYLHVAPRSGFLFVNQGDIGAPYANHGPVVLKRGELHLSFSIPMDDGYYPGLAKTFVPVEWGKRKYLIDSKKIINFCNQVNEGREPRSEIYGFCMLQIGDEEKKATGFPGIPNQFRSYVLAKPIEAEIIAVQKPTGTSGEAVNKTVINITLNRGKKAGLLPGMELHVVEPVNVWDAITVTEAKEASSEATIVRYRPNGVLGIVSLLDKNPKIGWKLSTRSAWEAKCSKR